MLVRIINVTNKEIQVGDLLSHCICIKTLMVQKLKIYVLNMYFKMST